MIHRSSVSHSKPSKLNCQPSRGVGFTVTGFICLLITVLACAYNIGMSLYQIRDGYGFRYGPVSLQMVANVRTDYTPTLC